MSIKEWYSSQTPREQLIVATTAIVGIAALVYTLAYKPLSTGIESRQISVAAKQRDLAWICLLYTSPSPRDRTRSRMPSSA